MTQVIKATGDGAGLFNAIAIGLGIEILSGRLELQKDAPGYQELLNQFAAHHPNFKPKTWETLKQWLAFYNSPRDLELILSPVLFQLYKKYQDNLEHSALEELTHLVWKNKKNITENKDFYTFDLTECLKIDNLDKKYKNELLTKLKPIIKEWNDNLSQNDYRLLLEQHAKDILEELKEQIKADKNAFQRAYSLNDLKKVTDSLSININNSEFNDGDKKNKLSLTNKDADWSVLSEETDVDQFISSDKARLDLTLEDALSGAIPIPAPDGSPRTKKSSAAEKKSEVKKTAAVARSHKSKDDEDVSIVTKEVDNPGSGDCAFYAFAIGIIHIIQEEKSYNKRAMFDHWVQLDDSLTGLYDDICNFDYDRRDRKLLSHLQKSLRNINYLFQADELKRACVDLKKNTEHDNPLMSVEQNSNYINFSGLYYKTLVDQNNPFAKNPVVVRALEKLRKKVDDEISVASVDGPVSVNDADMIERRMLVGLFVELIYGKGTTFDSIDSARQPQNDSPIFNALLDIKKNIWGTHVDLEYLARVFKVNLHAWLNGEPTQRKYKDDPELSTVIVHNHGRYHWTTEIPIAHLKSEITPGNGPVSLGVDSGSKRKSSFNRSTFDIVKTEVEPPVKKQGNDSKVASVVGSFFPAQVGITKKDRKKEKNSSPLLIEDFKQASAEDQVPMFDGESETQKTNDYTMEHLKRCVGAAAIAYLNHSNSIWFSLFHFHGEAGRLRAGAFNAKFSRVRKPESAARELIRFLSDANNGNTHPHSFRTMLLHELITTEHFHPTLQVVSAHYNQLLTRLAEQLNVESIPGNTLKLN